MFVNGLLEDFLLDVESELAARFLVALLLQLLFLLANLPRLLLIGFLGFVRSQT